MHSGINIIATAPAVVDSLSKDKQQISQSLSPLEISNIFDTAESCTQGCDSIHTFSSGNVIENKPLELQLPIEWLRSALTILPVNAGLVVSWQPHTNHIPLTSQGTLSIAINLEKVNGYHHNFMANVCRISLNISSRASRAMRHFPLVMTQSLTVTLCKASPFGQVFVFP